MNRHSEAENHLQVGLVVSYPCPQQGLSGFMQQKVRGILVFREAALKK